MKTVASRMSRNVLFVRETDPLRKVVELVVEKKIRHVPVLAEMEQLVGIVTDRDIRRAQPSPLFAQPPSMREVFAKTPVSAVMAKDPLTVHPAASIYDTIGLMIEHRFGAIPVVEEGTLVGIFTEIDALRYCIEHISTFGD